MSAAHHCAGASDAANSTGARPKHGRLRDCKELPDGTLPPNADGNFIVAPPIPRRRK
jgi:hypothetical protein